MSATIWVLIFMGFQFCGFHGLGLLIHETLATVFYMHRIKVITLYHENLNPQNYLSFPNHENFNPPRMVQ